MIAAMDKGSDSLRPWWHYLIAFAALYAVIAIFFYVRAMLREIPKKAAEMHNDSFPVQQAKIEALSQENAELRRLRWSEAQAERKELRKALNGHRIGVMKSLVDAELQTNPNNPGAIPQGVREHYSATGGDMSRCTEFLRKKLIEMGEHWDPEEEWLTHTGQSTLDYHMQQIVKTVFTPKVKADPAKSDIRIKEVFRWVRAVSNETVIDPRYSWYLQLSNIGAPTTLRNWKVEIMSGGKTIVCELSHDVPPRSNATEGDGWLDIELRDVPLQTGLHKEGRIEFRKPIGSHHRDAQVWRVTFEDGFGESYSFENLTGEHDLLYGPKKEKAG